MLDVEHLKHEVHAYLILKVEHYKHDVQCSFISVQKLFQLNKLSFYTYMQSYGSMTVCLYEWPCEIVLGLY